MTCTPNCRQSTMRASSCLSARFWKQPHYPRNSVVISSSVLSVGPCRPQRWLLPSVSGRRGATAVAHGGLERAVMAVEPVAAAAPGLSSASSTRFRDSRNASSRWANRVTTVTEKQTDAAERVYRRDRLCNRQLAFSDWLAFVEQLNACRNKKIYHGCIGSASASVHMSVTTPPPSSSSAGGVYTAGAASSSTLPANLDKVSLHHAAAAAATNGDETPVFAFAASSAAANDAVTHSRSSSKKSNHSIHSLPGMIYIGKFRI
jgi:hypothetical protein